MLGSAKLADPTPTGSSMCAGSSRRRPTLRTSMRPMAR